jgi:NAD+ kinase
MSVDAPKITPNVTQSVAKSIAFHHIALVTKPPSLGAGVRASDSAAKLALKKIIQLLHELGITVSIETVTAAQHGLDATPDIKVLSVDEIGESCDLVLTIGGDGTVLGIGRQLARHGTPLVGINQGHLGFMTDVPLNGFETLLTPILHGRFEREERSMLSAQVLRGDQPLLSTLAMNDVVVSRGASAGMVELAVTVNNSFMYSQRADGLIVATPTGSTAYALSAQGPILHPQLGGFVLVPIAPHSLSNRPIALPDTAVIEIEVVAGRDANVNFDMQSLTELQHGDRIIVRRAEHSAVLIHPVGYSYFATLREKLHWHET